MARHFALGNATFLHGDAVEVDWSQFDAFYFFNPFAEHLRSPPRSSTTSSSSYPDYFRFYVKFVGEQLAAARVGTRVVTYHGFGGDAVPAGYELVRNEQAGSDRLELWVKRAARRAGAARSKIPRDPDSTYATTQTITTCGKTPAPSSSTAMIDSASGVFAAAREDRGEADARRRARAASRAAAPARCRASRRRRTAASPRRRGSPRRASPR